jgi:hypothetical protein
MYYHREKVHPSWHEILSIPDVDYDNLELEYRKLSNELGLPPSVSEMVDFDFLRPSCKMVMKKLSTKRESNNGQPQDDTGTFP